MERLKRSAKGFTLLELIIAILLSTVVFLAATNLMINFGRFSSKVVKAESSLIGTSVGAFEEMVRRIESANKAAINGSEAAITSYPTGCAGSNCIQLRVDNPASPTPATFGDDYVYTYWLTAVSPATVPVTYDLRRYGDTGDPATGRIIATDITSLSFAKDTTGTGQLNRITVILEAKAASGPKEERTTEHLETAAVMGPRSANLP